MKRAGEPPIMLGHQRGRPRYSRDSGNDNENPRAHSSKEGRQDQAERSDRNDDEFVHVGRSGKPEYYVREKKPERSDRNREDDRRLDQFSKPDDRQSEKYRTQGRSSQYSQGSDHRSSQYSQRGGQKDFQGSQSSYVSHGNPRGSGRGRGTGSRGDDHNQRGGRGGRGARGGRGNSNANKSGPLALPPPDKEFLVTKPKESTKQGDHHQRMLLKVNYFRLPNKPQRDLIQYRVDFSPEIESTQIKKGLMRTQKHKLGGYLFDGTCLYLTQRLAKNPMVLMTRNKSNDSLISINIREVSVVSKTSYIAFQILNLVLRNAMEGLRLQLVGRNYFDANAKIPVDQFRLQLWPGYVTSIRQHERDILLVVEVVHKTMRSENVYHILTDCIKQSRSGDYKEAFKKKVLGTTVLTDYNNKTYKIDDVDFDTTPEQTFATKQGETSFVGYYRTKYNIIIKDPRQPMLISRAKARDIRAGMAEQIALIPELCRATGLTDEMRKNFQLMKACADHTRLDPMNYQRRLRIFNQRLRDSQHSTEALNEFNLEMDRDLVEVRGAVLPGQKLVFASSIEVEVKNANWDNELRNCCLYNSVDLKRWFVISPAGQCEDHTRLFVNDLIKVSLGMQFRLDPPTWLIIHRDVNDAYIKALDEVMSRDPRLILVMVPNNRADRYSLIKCKTLIGRSIPTQVIIHKTIQPKQSPRGGGNLLSVATKVAIQMNCKIGGVPWMIKIPLAALMTVGFDVYHDTRDKSRSYGALIATMDLQKAKDPQHMKFFSSVSAHKNGEELSNDISINIRKALTEFRNQHDCLPRSMIFYRDGVGDGQIEYVKMHEVAQLHAVFNEVYGQKKLPLPKLIYIVVNKRINTRIFNGDRNPVPGTIVDDVITLPERYDFYMVAQSMRQGTAAPTSYNIIEDTFGMPPERIQELTYRFCHLYYNWGGTIRTPAVCQYAHKLAYLVGEYLHTPPSNGCEKSLYFL